MTPETIFSPCRTWRYTLARDFGYLFASDPRLNVILLNPSTADEQQDDPTVRRCMGYAKQWGYGGLVVTNLFALRGTDPACLKTAVDPVGPENDRYLLETAKAASRVIVAWGGHGHYLSRGQHVAERLYSLGIPLYCLGRTKGGEPRHPLYLPKAALPMPYRVE